MRHAALSRLLALSLVLEVGGCLTEPNAGVVQGVFGGYLLGVTATVHEARYDFACGRGVTGPLRIGSDGTAIARGLVWGFSAGTFTDSLLVVARLHGNLLDVTHTIVSGGTPHTGRTVLRLGAAPDFSGVACPAG